jgi:hypothetical protein
VSEQYVEAFKALAHFELWICFLKNTGRAIHSKLMCPSRRALTWVIVAAWLLLGPVAMAFGGCLLMSDCEALCGTVACAQLASTLIAVALVCTSLWTLTTLALLTPALFVIEPPPRLHLPA